MSHCRLLLVVEDDPNDLTLLRAAFEDIGFENPLQIVENGREAIEYLSGSGQYQDRTLHPYPSVMLLDLKLPGMNGFAVLAWLRNHPEFKVGLRVVVHTSLVWAERARTLRAMGADEVLEKPLGYERLRDQLSDLKKRWLDGPPEPDPTASR